MWLIYIITLANACINNDEVVNKVRLDLGSFPVNLFDVLFAVGGLLIAIDIVARRAPTDLAYVSRTVKLTGVAFVALLWVGVTLALLDGIHTRYWLTCARNFSIIPLGAAMGFFLTKSLTDVQRYLRLNVIAGVAVSAVLIRYFVTKGSMVTASSSIFELRTCAYIADYATFGLCLALWIAMRAATVQRMLAMLAIGAFCLVGQFCTLVRSEWLACVCGAGAVLVVAPRALGPRSVVVAAIAVAVGASAVAWGLGEASELTHRDFSALMAERVQTLVPGDASSLRDNKAWESRVPGIEREIELWSDSPVVGRGFGIQDEVQLHRRYHNVSFHHNAFTDFLVDTGVLGFGAVLCMFGSMLALGRRLARAPATEAVNLMGAFGLVALCFYVPLGVCTGCFNTPRGAIPLAFTWGILVKCYALWARAATADPGAACSDYAHASAAAAS